MTGGDWIRSSGGAPVGVPPPGVPPPGVPPPGVPPPGVPPPGVPVSVMFVVIVVEHVTVLPPPFSEPLHWSTVTGNAALVVPDAVQTKVAPPPLPEPLHWVTTGEPCELGMQAVVSAPPPWPDPLH